MMNSIKSNNNNNNNIKIPFLLKNNYNDLILQRPNNNKDNHINNRSP